MKKALPAETETRLERHDMPPERLFARSLRLAQDLSGAAVAGIYLLSTERLWLKSAQSEPQSLPAEGRACIEALQTSGRRLARDLQADARFAEVARWLLPKLAPLQFYAGVPLTDSQGAQLGSLFVLDVGAQADFGAAQLDGLADLAALLAETLEMQQVTRELGETQARQERSETVALVMASHIGLDGRWLKVTPPLCQFLGYSEAELLARTLQDISHPEDLMADLELTERLARAERDSFEFEKRYLRKDGEVVWAYINATLVRDAQGQGLHFLSYIRNVTDEKRAQEQLSLQSTLLAEVRNAVIATDLAGQIIYWNRAAERLFGWQAHEVMTQRFNNVYVTPEGRALEQTIRDTVIQHGLWEGEIEERHRDGSSIPTFTAIAALRDHQGSINGFVGVKADIGDLKRSEGALREASAEAQLMARRMQAVAVAAAQILGAQTHEGLQDVLRRACAQVITFDYFTFGLYNATERSLHYLEGYDNDVFLPARDIPLRGPTERVISTRRSLLTATSGEAAAQGSFRVGTGQASESVIRSPILAGDEALGILSVQSYTPQLYSPQDVEVVETIAAIAATALKNLEYQRAKKEAQAELQRSERRFKSLVQHASDAITLLDAEGRILYTSPSLETLLGYEQLEGQSVFAFIHAKDHAKAVEMYQQLVSKGGSVTLAARFLHQSGAWHTLEGSLVSLLHDPDVQAVVANVRDITERRSIERALRESETRYRTLFHSIDQGFCVIEMLFDAQNQPQDYRFLEVNPTFERQTGLKDAVGKTARELVPDLDMSWVERYGQVAISGESLRLESDEPALGRWFDVFAFRPGKPEEHKVAVLFKDMTQNKQAEVALRESERRFRSMADTAPAILWVTNTEQACTFLSQGWFDYTGQAIEAALGFGWLEIVHPDDRAEAARAFRSASEKPQPFSIDYRLRCHDGSYRWVLDAARPRFNDRGDWLGYIGSVIDVHDRKLATDALKEREGHLERMAAFRHSLMELAEESLSGTQSQNFYERILSSAVATIPGAQAGSIQLRNQDGYFAFEAASGYDLAQLRHVFFPPHVPEFGTGTRQPKIINGNFLNPVIPAEQQEILRTAGRINEIQTVLLVPILADAEIVAYLTLDNFECKDAFNAESVEMARIFAGHIVSLMKRFRLEGELHQLAYTDTLTGLANRAFFKEQLQRTLAGAQEDGSEVAVIFIDLDNLKPINDSLGHKAGDEVLQGVAARLQTCARPSDLVARLSGDEFTLVLKSHNATEDARQAAMRILASLTEPVETHIRDVHVSASLGISLYPHDGERAEDLLKRADIAMYHAKLHGKNTHSFFQQKMEAAPLERLLLEEALRRALEHDEFILHYQPRLDLRTGKLVSLEALVRWQHPERNLIPPGLFIPLMENTNLIYPLGKRVLELACQQGKRWSEAGYRDYRIAVNLSAKQLQHADIVQDIRSILEANGLPGSILEIEILESAAMTDVMGNSAKLQQLQSLGIRIALDDFGTGYSSLSYLRDLPLDTIKIDRSFLAGLCDERTLESNLAIIRAIIVLGQNLGLAIVAEGIEHKAQWQLLKDVGCDEGQGYYLSKPLEAAAAEGWLEGGGEQHP